MSHHAILAPFAFLVLFGCHAAPTPNHKDYAAEPPTTHNATLHGLQSLTRVCVSTIEYPENLKAELLKQLHDQLPQLDTTGPADGWTLHFEFGTTLAPEWPPRSNGTGPMVPVAQCRARIIRTIVVEARQATAITYEGPRTVEMPNGLPAWSEAARDERTRELLRQAIGEFAQAWRAANVGP